MATVVVVVVVGGGVFVFYIDERRPNRLDGIDGGIRPSPDNGKRLDISIALLSVI